MPLFTYYLFICLSIYHVSSTYLLSIYHLSFVYHLSIICLSTYLSIVYQSVYLTVYPPSNHLFFFLY